MDYDAMYTITTSTDDKKPLKEIFDLSGKTAVVTGGCTGLGYSVASRLAEAGARVVIASRDAEKGAMIEKHFRDDLGYDVSFVAADVKKVEDCYGMIEFAEKKYGKVDILVPCAAVWYARAFVDMKPEEFDDIIETDMRGQYFSIQAAARSMIRNKVEGKIVTVASVSHRSDDIKNIAMMTHYNTAKGGVVSMTRGIARELKQYGIGINCVAPGAMLTYGAMTCNASAAELYGSEWEDAVAENATDIPMSDSPDDVAMVIFTLCTDVANFMFGQVLDVDGGSQFSFQEEPWSYTMEGGTPGPK
ncbi:SDR family oxidoreductase [Clostridia bacterium OttesenSCG-928-O13]|nr:SDR family oxidoreductase [Clostridia bacterium OttesenSCG-928-O13]